MKKMVKLSVTFLLHQGDCNKYVQCFRGKCSKVEDDPDLEFDQPVPEYINMTRKHFPNQTDTKRFSVDMEPEEDLVVPKLIHMVWVGSSLPLEYYKGPLSAVQYNPDYEVFLWLDEHTPVKEDLQNHPNIKIKNIKDDVWLNQDLLDQCTNFAMFTDILRMDILYKYGGIYLDMDSLVKRRFGPVFSTSFVTYTPHDYYKDIDWMHKSGVMAEHKASIENAQLGMPKGSKFMKYILGCLKENFFKHTPTLQKTGPQFFTAAFLEYIDNNKIKLINWKYTVKESPDSVIVDHPLDADWSDKENILIGQKYCRNKDNPGNCEGL
ncbi:inositol phosphoceramide mannosyltransferase 3 [Eurytemora carolleeae]|uniref:inositol phosphoceramide mannosyltransferase 3 n=1 Tax=Eurytemora carolleeae TaxID=1294199 RepID=UPI000C78741E|nr:inositol phosphoceramide mannosyltransferase 3 [Eurytemora carolleeae]|eukprot:XP_023335559.1 inositol phosphoceramide mannosyltransferase 3-like [Eurytemora affinis]